MHIAEENAPAPAVELYNSVTNYCALARGKLAQDSARICCLVLLAPLVAGCLLPGALSGPDRLYPVQQELAPIRAYFDDADVWARYYGAPSKILRNDIITARMYAIDVNYTEYEARLTREGQELDLATGVTNEGLTLAAGVVGGAAAKALSQAASGVGYLGSAYNEKVLLKQTIQHIQAGMRQARYEQAAVILANMQCDLSQYPLGFAMSDIELYYRAGTFESGLIKVTENVSKATSDAQATKDSQAPGKQPDAVAKLAANVTLAKVKVAEAAPSNPCIKVGSNGQRSPTPINPGPNRERFPLPQ